MKERLTYRAGAVGGRGGAEGETQILAPEKEHPPSYRFMPRGLGWSYGAGRFLMSEVPLHQDDCCVYTQNPTLRTPQVRRAAEGAQKEKDKAERLAERLRKEEQVDRIGNEF